ncbi:hypothetical protein [uncultured Thiodictyon sp.]|uniref:hypothetical protein n=1 Tax=uncultured Thiodictyon sp. TaxID=1846217 RepID=UPI0025EC9474|nr:hypothetical protein [uncultured Thiodictyon sp.]
MSASNEGFGVAVPGLAVILTIIGVFILKSGPLETKRPPNPQLGDQAFSDQQVPARLWQDPFEAAERYLASHKSVPNSSQPDRPGDPDSAAVRSLRDLIAKRWRLPWDKPTVLEDEPRCWPDVDGAVRGVLPAADGDRTQLLAVLVDAGPYAESAESRVRSRYAILSALAVSGYQPVDPTHVGYVQFSGDDGRPTVVPFERLQRKASTGSVETLMLLWLSSEAFHGKPIRGIRALVAYKVPNASVCKPIKVIGPGDSDGLAALRHEAAEARKTRSVVVPLREPRRLEFYAATPTATDVSLSGETFLTNPSAHPCQAVGVQGCQSDPIKIDRAVFLSRPIPDDSQLALQLIEELGLRGFGGSVHTIPNRVFKAINKSLGCFIAALAGVDRRACGASDSAQRRKHIVLISEWDTTYGRSLPVAVGKELLGVASDPLAQRLASLEQLQGHRWLHYYSYMRGLDGNIPAGKDKSDASGAAHQSGAERAAAQPKPTDTNERAEGQAQLDYLRRLTQELAGLKNADGRPARIFAIGILGSDLYDKMLILQALRPAFPGTLFFTTDLDARMLDGAYVSYTRGLIVASGYGLEPTDYDPRASIPPFRTNYQTAIYHAVRQAFPSAAASWNDPVDGDMPDVVRLYEIGRNGPNRLVLCRDCHAQRPQARGRHASTGADPVGPAVLDDVIDWILAVGFFAAAGVWILLSYQPGIRRFLWRHPLGFVAALTGGALVQQSESPDTV